MARPAIGYPPGNPFHWWDLSKSTSEIEKSKIEIILGNSGLSWKFPTTPKGIKLTWYDPLHTILVTTSIFRGNLIRGHI